MQVLLLVFLFALFFTLLLACFGTYILFGELVQLEHDRYQDEWQHDGRPFAFFHRPDTGELLLFRKLKYGCKGIQSFWISLVWFLRTPRWAVNDSEASRLLWWFRTCVLFWNFGMLPAVIAFLWFVFKAHTSHPSS